MKRLVFSRRGWFRCIEFLTGTRIAGTDLVRPDEYGCFKRRLLIGPFDTAGDALVNTVQF